MISDLLQTRARKGASLRAKIAKRCPLLHYFSLRTLLEILCDLCEVRSYHL